QRRHEVRATALVLLAGLRRVLVLLVGGDRLVLDAVVRGQVAAAQREERRHQAHARNGQLPRHGSRPGGAERLARRRRARHRPEPELLRLGHPSTSGASPAKNRVAIPRSSTGIRSSAPWISGNASKRSIRRRGKNPYATQSGNASRNQRESVNPGRTVGVSA